MRLSKTYFKIILILMLAMVPYHCIAANTYNIAIDKLVPNQDINRVNIVVSKSLGNVISAFILKLSQQNPKIQYIVDEVDDVSALVCSKAFNQFDIIIKYAPISDTQMQKCLSNKSPVSYNSPIVIGYNTITIMTNLKKGFNDLTTVDLYKAISKYLYIDGRKADNNYKTWTELNALLPDIPITFTFLPNNRVLKQEFVNSILQNFCNNLFATIKSFTPTEADKQNCVEINSDKILTSQSKSYLSLKQDIEFVKNAPNVVAISLYSVLAEYPNNLYYISLNPSLPTDVTDTTNVTDPKEKMTIPIYMYINTNHLKYKKNIAPVLKILTPVSEIETIYVDTLQKHGIIFPNEDDIGNNFSSISKLNKMASQ